MNPREAWAAYQQLKGNFTTETCIRRFGEPDQRRSLHDIGVEELKWTFIEDSGNVVAWWHVSMHFRDNQATGFDVIYGDRRNGWETWFARWEFLSHRYLGE
jgi:hypothetical protein